MVFRKLSVTRRPSVGWVFLPETEMFPTSSLRVPLELARRPQFFAWQNISLGPASERLCWSWMPPTIEELMWSETRSKCLRSRKWHYPKAEFPMGSNILYTDLLILHLKLSNYSVAKKGQTFPLALLFVALYNLESAYMTFCQLFPKEDIKSLSSTRLIQWQRLPSKHLGREKFVNLWIINHLA